MIRPARPQSASASLPSRCLLIAAAFAATLVACGGNEPSSPTSDVVAAIPWQGNESLSYVLKDKDGAVVGRGTLLVALTGEGTTGLAQAFQNETNRDESSVIVDSRTLKPKESTRTIVTADDVDTVEATYSEEGVLIRHGEKQSGLSVPDHAYDNDTSLFLWRTIDFRQGYEASYVTIITNRRSRQAVSLRVAGKETVRVAAGEFECWRLEVRTSNTYQVAWYADTPTRPLIRYDNDNGLIFELETAP